jgi:predicted Zn-dependent protease
MNKQLFNGAVALLASIALVGSPALAQGQKKTLDDRDNPLLIGKRDINNHQIDFYSIDKEIALGRQLAAETDRQSKFVTDPLVNEYVNRVGQNLVLHSDAKVPFTIKVIDSEEINAFALPGGFLYVNRGVLEAADNEAEMAGVIAHEIGHVAARHGVEQASKANLLNYGSIPLIFLGGWGGFAIRQAAGLAVPLSFLKFSRGAEKEADRLGAQYLWASGYDPHAMITFFEKLEAKEKKKPGAIAKVFATHPMTNDRITEAQSLIARFPDRQEYELSSSEFKDVKSLLVSISVAQRGAPAGNNRPTLKRRRGGTDDSDSQPTDRPTLKRGTPAPPEDPDTPAESTGPDSTKGSGQSGESSGRPTLRRRPDSSADPNNNQNF